jgi:hypothetical protein
MGERDWYARYKHAKAYADEQAAMYERGDEISHWRYQWEQRTGEPEPPKETLTGAAWVAWAYEIAASEAHSVVQTKGQHWQGLVDGCERLVARYKALANAPESVGEEYAS